MWIIIGHCLQYAVALRVPLLALGFLVGFPMFAFGGGRSLFRGMFDLTPASLLIVTVSAWALAATAARTAKLVLLYGNERFSLPALAPEGRLHAFVLNNYWQANLVWLSGILLLTLCCYVLPSIMLSRKQGQSLWRLIGAALLGLDGASFLTWKTMVAGLKISDCFASGTLQWGVVKYFLYLAGKEGYASCPRQWTDHCLTMLVFLLTVMVWGLLGVYGYFMLGKPRTVPALASLIQLVVMITWFLAATTFLLDHWHIPLLLVIALWTGLNAVFPFGDYTYRLVTPEGGPGAPPGELLGTAPGGKVIVAAAMGGGIQAAAWTALVLEQLQEIEGFVPALRMVSGVSGGSMGAACFVNSLLDGMKPNPEAVTPFEAASASSLDEVAWALTWPDFLRTLFPLAFGWVTDRGRTLELAWSRNSAKNPTKTPQLTRPLSDWNAVARSGKAPALIMNSTIVESGKRLLIGTSEVSIAVGAPGEKSAWNLHRLTTKAYPEDKQFDIAAVTAARLSAAFPWVSPAARADKSRTMLHIVDGGYYDNYGIASLVEWLDEALETTPQGVREILVLQIRCMPEGATALDRSDRKSRGWIFQAVAPILAVLGVRSAAQEVNDNKELELLVQKWANRKIAITPVTFQFCDDPPVTPLPKKKQEDGANAPLSWHLTQEEKDRLKAAWRAPSVQKSRSRVSKFLQPMP